MKSRISEGSCDTEDWSNDAENSALHHRNKLNLKIYSNKKTVIWNCNNISQYYCFYCIFNQINAALVRIRDFLPILTIWIMVYSKILENLVNFWVSKWSQNFHFCVNCSFKTIPFFNLCKLQWTASHCFLLYYCSTPFKIEIRMDNIVFLICFYIHVPILFI